MVREPWHPGIWRGFDERGIRVRQIREHAVQRREDEIRPGKNAKCCLDQQAQTDESLGDTNTDCSISMIFCELDRGNKLPAN